MMRWRHGASWWAAWATIGAVMGSDALAQEHAHARSLVLGATATGIWTYVEPAIAGESLSEGYLSQPALMGHADLWSGRLSFTTTINLEGLTLKRGELATGNAGEGYVDRRHPHTYLHEAMIVARIPEFNGLQSSIAAGRGFAPFGTDDPMMRPFTKYPGNHHLAQVLERWVAMAAVRLGAVMIEAGLFNGDEPVAPDDLSRAERFGDSWSLRATILPTRCVELQGSHAFVESPEHALGGGLDHSKWSTSARLTGSTNGLNWYGLVEWARTDEYSFGLQVFTFTTALAEMAAMQSGWQAAVRLERTTRPEEVRIDPFRTARPHAGESIVGMTRWTSVTSRLGRTVRGAGLEIEPFAEVAFHDVKETSPGFLFDPIEHYGDDKLWNVSVGARIGVGTQHTRMGRYGVAVPRAHAQGAEVSQLELEGSDDAL